MPADIIETIADKIAGIVLDYDADSAEARGAMDKLIETHGRAAVSAATEYVRAKVAG